MQIPRVKRTAIAVLCTAALLLASPSVRAETMEVVLLDHDLSGAISAKFNELAMKAGRKPKMIVQGALRMRVVVDLPASVQRRIDRNPLLRERVWLAMTEPRDKAIDLTANAYDAADVLLQKADTAHIDDIRKTVRNAVQGQPLAIQQAENDARILGQRAWDKHVGTMKEGAGYKARLAVRFIGPIAAWR